MSSPLGVSIWLFLENFFSNFHSHTKDSKWGRKCISINSRSCNGSHQQIPFQFANGKLPCSCCRAFWTLLDFLPLVLEFSYSLLIWAEYSNPNSFLFKKIFMCCDSLVNNGYDDNGICQILKCWTHKAKKGKTLKTVITFSSLLDLNTNLPIQKLFI